MILLMAACGFDPDPYHDMLAGEEVYSYEFAEGACSTGRRVFLDKTRFCSALTDEALNGRCAAGQRLQLHTKRC